MIVSSKESKDYLLKLIIGKSGDDLTLRLFSNDIEPDIDSNRKQFIEVINYMPTVLLDFFWTMKKNYLQVDNLFYLDNVGSIFGYYITTENLWLWAERFSDGVYDSKSNKDKLKIKINMFIV